MPHKHSVTYIIKEECKLKKHKQTALSGIDTSLKLTHPAADALLSPMAV